MKHRKKNIKFRDGKDSDKMIIRKLMKNFLLHAHLETTQAKAKALKIYLERVISKTKEDTQANKNYILSYFPEKKFVDALFNQVGPAVREINGGYVRVVRLNQRENDGTMMMKVEWAHPVVIDWEDSKDQKNTQSKEKETDKKEQVTKTKDQEIKKSDTKKSSSRKVKANQEKSTSSKEDK